MQRINKTTLFVVTLLLASQIVIAQYDTIFSGGFKRSFLLQLPDNYSEESNLPLMLVLHGYHTENLGMPGYTGFDQFVDRDVIVAYPHGLKEENGDNYFWNSGGGHIINYGGVDDVGFISNLIDTLSDNYAVNTDSVFIVGHSNGGMMVYRLAMEISEKITAMANLAGSMMFDSIVPDRPVPILHIHGTNDQSVRLTGSTSEYWPYLPIDDVLNQWAEWNNCEPNPVTLESTSKYEYLRWADIDDNNQVLAAYITNQGHDWATITNSGWDIAENIWSFFTAGELLSYPSAVESISTNSELKLIYHKNNRNLEIISENGTISQIKIYDLTGKIAVDQVSSQNGISLDRLTNGIYMVHLMLDDKMVSRKILVN